MTGVQTCLFRSLYLVYNEVRKFNGDISVDSTVGVGTKFNIFLDFEMGKYER